jgi:hypothetical protein
VSGKLLLTSDSEVQIAGLYFQAVRDFGRDLGALVDEKFKSKSAPDWFDIVKKARLAEKAPVYDDPFDPRFLIKEAIIPNSPVAMAIPFYGPQWRETAFALRSQMNKWSHFSVAPTIPNLLAVFETIHRVASLSKMALAEDLIEGIDRLKSLLAGEFQFVDSESDNSAQVAEITDSEARDYAERLASKIEEIEKRPPVGSVWTGAKGTRKIVINKALRDVTENGVSIRSSLGPDADAVVSQWLRYYPMGGEAKVAPDGAVMGFRQGTPYLIGWIGTQQEQETLPKGFFLDHDFEFIGTDVRDVQTGELLSKAAREPIDWLLDELAKAVPIGSVFNVTTYGQIVFEDFSGEFRKVANVHKDIWFPGQLPE